MKDYIQDNQMLPSKDERKILIHHENRINEIDEKINRMNNSSVQIND